METDSASTFNAKPPPLNSDQLNYLIWRYLQESGYADAAVKLQRDWKVDAENLSFAKNIKGHALVHLVQKGLRYHHLSLTIDENGRPSKQLNPAMFFFGPESNEPPPELREESIPAPSPAPSSSTARRGGRESVPNGFPDNVAPAAPKRGRKTAAGSERNGSVARKPSGTANHAGLDAEMANGHPASIADARSPTATEGGADENGTLPNGDRMDIDEDSLNADHQHHDANPQPVAPLIHTLTNGASIGVQVAPAKVANLTPLTTYLSTQESVSTAATKHLTRVAWRAADSNVVTAIGDDFCGVWNLGNHLLGSKQQPPFQELMESSESTIVSAVAWEPNGEMLAIATYSNQAGQIHLFDGQELALMETLPASQRAITSLRWQGQGLRLLGVAPYESESSDSPQHAGSSILLWDLSRSPNFTGPLSVSVPEVLVDMDCALFNGNGVVCATGQRAVYFCYAFSDLVLEKKWTSDATEDESWTFIRCAWHESSVATLVAASAETGSIWLPVQGLVKKGAHEAAITGLELRPRLASTSPALKQDFATSSMDGTVKVWRWDQESNSIMSICKLVIGYASPVMALSYSPDGFCLSGASYDTIRIWNAEHAYNHMATWKGEAEAWNGARLRDDDMVSVGGASSVNGDTIQANTDHSLSWDVDSKKLAFGLGVQVAVINFQR
ncbi:hypothetical protein, variant 1 [Exophiala oligosperma]|uniref:Anaphase-promoting complex subunit 4-like WD40 domain-containing protein n=2 Tax=Exophiala oligosperma TaxID=215243 RepID=A0A0D2DT18_9EURO|nr:uncharacterized protein PV06_04004 [Exophiala oligosperma]XP_016265846.1 hypothetical protein, variant 1 [Exophiala oligosperma]KIW45629.1 hypothetical protein PV06_04004 [Exophiala oligosperma]KIW45630.1 hypothetical protein, variant 1 [Exophiala oligosperma]